MREGTHQTASFTGSLRDGRQQENASLFSMAADRMGRGHRSGNLVSGPGCCVRGVIPSLESIRLCTGVKEQPAERMFAVLEETPSFTPHLYNSVIVMNPSPALTQTEIVIPIKRVKKRKHHGGALLSQRQVAYELCHEISPFLVCVFGANGSLDGPRITETKIYTTLNFMKLNRI